MIDLGNDHAIDAILKGQERLRTALTGANPNRCCLCDCTCYQTTELEYDIETVAYENDCPRCGELSLLFVRVYGRLTDGHQTARINTTARIMCLHPGCDGPLVPPHRGATERERCENTLPVARMLNMRCEEHHVSYEPESTIPVCRQCHGKIHSGEKDFKPLQPDQQRAEWEAAND